MRPQQKVRDKWETIAESCAPRHLQRTCTRRQQQNQASQGTWSYLKEKRGTSGRQTGNRQVMESRKLMRLNVPTTACCDESGRHHGDSSRSDPRHPDPDGKYRVCPKQRAASTPKQVAHVFFLPLRCLHCCFVQSVRGMRQTQNSTDKSDTPIGDKQEMGDNMRQQTRRRRKAPGAQSLLEISSSSEAPGDHPDMLMLHRIP